MLAIPLPLGNVEVEMPAHGASIHLRNSELFWSLHEVREPRRKLSAGQVRLLSGGEPARCIRRCHALLGMSTPVYRLLVSVAAVFIVSGAFAQPEDGSTARETRLLEQIAELQTETSLAGPEA